MARPHAALHEADLLIEQQHFSRALNRVYYAAFYAAPVMVATRSLDSSRHSGVIALFQEHFVRHEARSDRDRTRMTPCL